MQTFSDIARHRFILENLVAKNLKALYRNMALGFFWSILNPLVMAVVISVVQLAAFGTGRNWPSLFLVTLIPFNFFCYCLSGCAASVIGNASLVTKVQFPRQILPFSVIVTNLVHFALQSTLIVAALIWFGPQHHPDPEMRLETGIIGWQLLWLVPILIVNIGLVFGVGLLVAGANVVYRDVQYIVDSVLTVMFWVCPLLYDAGAMFGPERSWLYWLYFCNPLSGLLDSYRRVLYHAESPDPAAFGLAVGVTLLFGIWGIRSFWKHEHRFADLI